jgi:hypothetical protein
MQENHDYLGAKEDPNIALKGQVLILQLKGAGYAAIFCLALVLGVLALAWIGKLLPSESRDTEDPTPFSYIRIVEDTHIG